MHSSFGRQVERLVAAGFLTLLLVPVGQSLLNKVRGGPQCKKDRSTKRPIVIPYLHQISYNLKKVAQSYGVPIVYSAPNKLAELCPRVANKHGSKRIRSVKHRNKYVECTIGLVS